VRRCVECDRKACICLSTRTTFTFLAPEGSFSVNPEKGKNWEFLNDSVDDGTVVYRGQRSRKGRQTTWVETNRQIHDVKPTENLVTRNYRKRVRQDRAKQQRNNERTYRNDHQKSNESRSRALRGHGHGDNLASIISEDMRSKQRDFLQDGRQLISDPVISLSSSSHDYEVNDISRSYLEIENNGRGVKPHTWLIANPTQKIAIPNVEKKPWWDNWHKRQKRCWKHQYRTSMHSDFGSARNVVERTIEDVPPRWRERY